MGLSRGQGGAGEGAGGRRGRRPVSVSGDSRYAPPAWGLLGATAWRVRRDRCAQLVARLDIFDDDVTLRNILAPIGMRCVVSCRVVSLSRSSKDEGALRRLRIEIKH